MSATSATVTPIGVSSIILAERLEHPPVGMTDESGSGGRRCVGGRPGRAGGDDRQAVAGWRGTRWCRSRRSSLAKSATAGSHISPPVRRARRSNDDRSCPTVDPTRAVAACITSSTDASRRAFGWSNRQSAPRVATSRWTTSEASDVARPGADRPDHVVGLVGIGLDRRPYRPPRDRQGRRRRRCRCRWSPARDTVGPPGGRPRSAVRSAPLPAVATSRRGRSTGPEQASRRQAKDEFSVLGQPDRRRSGPRVRRVDGQRHALPRRSVHSARRRRSSATDVRRWPPPVAGQEPVRGAVPTAAIVDAGRRPG